MKAPLGRSFQSVMEELAEEMKKFSEMDHKEANSPKRTTGKPCEVVKTEGNHVR